MRCMSFSDRGVALLLFVAVALAVAIAAAPGCSAQVAQQEPPQWPPVVEFESASVSGQLELATPAGPVTVDLSTGLVSGDGEVELLSANLESEVAFSINGARQRVHLASQGSPSGDGWAQCLTADARAEIVAGLGVDITARPPGLHEACGPAMLDVQTPLGNWSMPQESAPD